LRLGTHNGIYEGDIRSGTFRKAGGDTAVHAVNSILQARNGMMWGACWGGLVRVDSTGRVEEVLGMRDGFFDREIKGIAEDINGHLWIGNYEGLYRYQPDAGKLIRLTAHDGLMSNNTLDRVFVSHDGMEVFVGQEGGVNIVDIDGLKRR